MLHKQRGELEQEDTHRVLHREGGDQEDTHRVLHREGGGGQPICQLSVIILLS